jgi:hypothetical protein
VRKQGEGDKGTMPLAEFTAQIQDEVNRQLNAL